MQQWILPAVWVLGILLPITGHSQPAPWYWWVSQLDGHKVCAQFMPQPGWRRAQGPFDNAQCKPQRQSLLPSFTR